MGFPKNLDEMTAAGYLFDNHTTCKGCGADIEWWTTPSNKSNPWVWALTFRVLEAAP